GRLCSLKTAHRGRDVGVRRGGCEIRGSGRKDWRLVNITVGPDVPHVVLTEAPGLRSGDLCRVTQGQGDESIVRLEIPRLLNRGAGHKRRRARLEHDKVSL